MTGFKDGLPIAVPLVHPTIQSIAVRRAIPHDDKP